MANTLSESRGATIQPFVFIGCFLGLTFWVIEAYFDTLMIEGASFDQRLFPSDPNELWMRGFVAALFVGFGLYAHFANKRIRSVERMNRDAAWLLRNALSKTIRGQFPVCVYCRKIRDDDGFWTNPERFIAAQTEAEFSVSVCGECQSHHACDHETR